MFGFTNDIMVNFSENFSLSTLNSFGFDINARFWTVFNNESELAEIINHCKTNSLQWFVLGGGSNIIFSRDFDGVVIHPVSKEIFMDGARVVVDAGVVWDDFVAWAVINNLHGVENLSHIPGSVGASPVQNIGAYGVEAADVIQWVEYFDTDSMQVVRIDGVDCEFGYRESVFKHSLRGRAIVLRVAFRLADSANFNIRYADVDSEVEKLGGISLHNVRQAIINIRSRKLPDPKLTGNAGSFFKNPVVDVTQFESLLAKHPQMPNFNVACGVKIPAGWLIEQAGWRGYRRGDAGVHPNQSLVLVNYGNASAADILTLSADIVTDVATKFGIILEKEVNVW